MAKGVSCPTHTTSLNTGPTWRVLHTSMSLGSDHSLREMTSLFELKYNFPDRALLIILIHHNGC